MKCPNCNCELEARTIFCAKCGEKIDYDVVDKVEAEANKTREDKYEEALESSPFAKVYAKKKRIWEIVIAILNIITFGMFYGNWYESKIGQVFGAGDYGFFEVYKTIIRTLKSGYLSNASIPFYFWLLLVAIVVTYLISSVYFFRSTVRIFAKKINVKEQKKANIYALVTCALNYLTMSLFQKGFDEGIGGDGIASYFISTSTFFIIFIVMNVLLLVLSNKKLRNSSEDFTRKGNNIFFYVSLIYLVGLIVAFLFTTGIIKFPEIKSQTNEYEEIYLGNNENTSKSSNGLYDNMPDYDEYVNSDSTKSQITEMYFPESGQTKYYINGQECDKDGNLIVENNNDIYNDAVETSAYYANSDLSKEIESIYSDWTTETGYTNVEAYKNYIREAYADYYVDDFLISDGILYDYAGTNERIDIPENVSLIYYSAFEGNESITYVRFYADCYVSKNAFKDCTNLFIFHIQEGIKVTKEK